MVAKANRRKFEVKKIDSTLDFDLGDETFHAKPELSGIALISFVRSIQSVNQDGELTDADPASATEVLDVLLGLLKHALGPREYDRFIDYMDSDDIVVPIETIMEIVQYLIQEYTGGNPTEAS